MNKSSVLFTNAACKAKRGFSSMRALLFSLLVLAASASAQVLDLSDIGTAVQTEVAGVSPVIVIVLGLMIAITVAIVALKKAK